MSRPGPAPSADRGAADGPLEPRDRTPAAVLEALWAGNARYTGDRPRHPHQGVGDREALVAGQRPIAAVVSCSDARVPPSVVLDQGLGDLFAIRVAGHVLGENVLASVHYAVRELGVPVVLVLGHEGCGAVGLALEALRDGREDDVPVVRQIAPSARAARSLCAVDADLDPHDEAVRIHAEATADALRSDPLLARRIAEGRLWIGPAVYRMSSGRIDGLDVEDIPS